MAHRLRITSLCAGTVPNAGDVDAVPGLTEPSSAGGTER